MKSAALSATILLAVIAAATTPLAGTVEAAENAGDEWPTFQRDWARTGHTTAQIPDHLDLLWTFQTEGEGEIDMSPAVADGRVYFTTKDRNTGYITIYSLDAENGEPVWSYPASLDAGAGFLPSLTVVGGRVYVGDVSHLYAFDAENGEQVWLPFEIPWGGGLTGVDSAPAVIENRVYFGSWDGWFYCIDANTGELIWEYSDGDGKMGHVIGTSAVVDGVVYFGTGAGSGKIKKNGHDYTGWAYALNAENGSFIWDFWIGDEIFCSPAVVDNKVFIGAGYFGHLPGDGMWCLNANTSKLVWYFETAVPVKSSPAVVNGRVYFGSNDDNVYCLDAEDNSVIWSYPTGGRVYSSPAVADGKVFVGSADGYIYSLDAENGDLVWNYRIGGVIGSSPAVVDNRVFIGDYLGRMYCFGWPPPPLIETLSDGQEVSGGVEVNVIAFGSHVKGVELNWGEGWVRAEYDWSSPMPKSETLHLTCKMYEWNTSAVPNGVYDLRVRAVYDGWYSDENIITLRVNNVPLGLIAWVVLIFALAFAALYLVRSVRRRG